MQLGNEKRWPFPPGCGLWCRGYEMISGTCEAHGPTRADKVVERVTSAFHNDLRSIIRSHPCK